MSSRKKRSETTVRTRTVGARSPAERLEPGRAPVRPRGADQREPSRLVGGLVRIVSGVFTLALVTMLVVGSAGFGVYYQFQNPGPLADSRTVVIPKGEGRIAIAERLEREGIIANRWTFIGGHMLQSVIGGRKNNDLKAGEYQIKEHASMREVLDILAEGKSVLYKVAIPEGLTSQQIVERITADPNLSGDIASIPSEGSLLPDTYAFSKGSSRQELIDRMQAAMAKAVAELWEKRPAESTLRSADDLVTFASIVEKETGRADERQRVSAVFHNRLKKGMRLQSDPTIIYGIVGGQGALGRGITRNDIETKTAYNTYQVAGLPPGPICNPGRASLEAAINPAQTGDLYFVADGTGGHVFSETLKEHNQAVQRWREVERQNKSDADAAADNPDVEPAADEKSKSVLVKVGEPAKETSKSKLIKAPASTSAVPLPTRKPQKAD